MDRLLAELNKQRKLEVDEQWGTPWWGYTLVIVPAALGIILFLYCKCEPNARQGFLSFRQGARMESGAAAVASGREMVPVASGRWCLWRQGDGAGGLRDGDGAGGLRDGDGAGAVCSTRC